MKVKALIVTLLLCAGFLYTHAQCTYQSVDFDGFEFAGNDPYLIPGTVYHLSPQSFLAYTGSTSIYMNFVNNLPPGTLVYDRPYTVCAGQTYRISAWFRETWGGSSNVTLELVDGGTVLDTWTGIIGSGAWFNYISNPVTPTGTTLEFKLYSNWMAGSNDLTMDDLELEMCEVPYINTVNLSFCTGQPSFDLHDSLSTYIGTSGAWTGPSGTTNGYLGTLDPQTAIAGTYTYTIAGAGVCPDSVEAINVTVSPGVDAGGDATIAVCSSQNNVDLFSSITGTPAQTGSWQGPDVLTGGYLGTFAPNTNAPGTYQYIVPGVGGCPSDTAEVTVGLLSSQLDLGIDTILCSGATLMLDAGAGYDSYEWQDGSTNQTFNVTAAGQYICEVGIVAANLIVNGDFEVGATGFTTSYIPGTGGAWGLLSNPGTYAVTTNPNLVHNNFSSCGDHTSGTGQMMVVNGATVPNTQVWCQTVSIQPNTDYLFSTWVMSAVNGGNVALLQFSINGTNLGNIFSPSSTSCIWQQFNTTWNSGANTSAQICIVNQNTTGGGNDFALDDIYFAPLCIATDTINVTYQTVQVDLGPDTAICAGDSVTFDAQNPGFTYLWNTAETTQTINASTAGTYDVTVTDNMGCTGNDAVTLTINPYPVVDLGPDTTLCDGDSVLLDVSGGNQTYLWSDNSTGGTLMVDVQGTYWVNVDDNGCVSSDTIDVSFVALPLVDLGPDTAFCDGLTLLLDAFKPGVTYLWNDNSTNSDLLVSTTNTYWVQLTNSSGCMGYDSIDVTVNPFPLVDLGNDVTFCQGEQHVITLNGTNETYLWNDNSTSNIYTITASGTYWVDVTALGCTSSDTINATVHPLPVFDFGPDLMLCEDVNQLLDPGVPGDTYNWNDGSSLPTLNVLNQPGMYALTIIVNNCVYSDSIFIDYTWFPTVGLPADTTICDEEELEITPVMEYQTGVLWQDGSVNDWYIAEEAEEVILTVQNSCGYASDTIVVSTTLCDCFLYLPNAFTPNGDGMNDFYLAEADCDITNYELMIFNRWGERIFKTEDIQIYWDGTYLGLPVPVDVYVTRLRYSAIINHEEVEFIKYGHVTVVR